MLNDQIAQHLALIGRLLELKGENPFKVRAYANASDAVEATDQDIADTLRAGQPLGVPGVGAGIAAIVRELVETGGSTLLAELQAEIPEGVVELSRVNGIGPKKLEIIWQQQGISSPEALQEAIRSGRLEGVKGLGGKTLATVDQALTFYLQQRGRMRLNLAQRLAAQLAPWLAAAPGVAQVELTGEVRRACPVSQSLDFVVAMQEPSALAGYLGSRLTNLQPLETPMGLAWGGATAQHQTVRVYGCTPADFAALLLQTSYPAGALPPALQAVLGQPAATEADLFAAAGAAYVDPALRDLEWSEQQRLAPQRLLAQSDLRGVLHNHSRWSDGTRTLREMAEAAQALGYTYLGISDHSRTAAYAGGLSIERVAQQHAEIEQLNRELQGFQIFKGIESDILGDGSLDYPDEVLAQFDFVVASIHQNLKMDEATATRRLVRAVEHPATSILGHPTGRLLLARAGYPIDYRAVIDACAANGVAIEVNANPYRLDLDWTWIPYALARGVRIAICPDAHSVEEYDYVRYGVAVARKGGLTAADTLNALDADEFAAWLQARKR